jgi:hypothetical protein
MKKKKEQPIELIIHRWNLHGYIIKDDVDQGYSWTKYIYGNGIRNCKDASVFWGRCRTVESTLILRPHQIEGELLSTIDPDKEITSAPIWHGTEYFVRVIDFENTILRDVKTGDPVTDLTVVNSVMPLLGYNKLTETEFAERLKKLGITPGLAPTKVNSTTTE